MSENHDPHTPASEPQFIPEELVEFKADDTEAGKNIGRMLVAFFVCLLVLVAGVNLLMERVVQARSTEINAPFAQDHHEDADHHE